MGRALLVSVVCLAVALFGVFGVHAHMPGTHHDLGGSASLAGSHAEHAGAYVVAVVDSDHSLDHDDDGDTDIDPVVKAFSKSLALAAAVIASPTQWGFLALSDRLIVLRIGIVPPLRPPKERSRFSLHPPSHAPPAPL
jgi:hypothetical protein